MASFTFVLLTASLFVAISSAAPQKAKLGITIPEACQGKGFCSIRPEGYDEVEEKINGLLPSSLIDVGSRYGTSVELPYDDDDDDNCPRETTWESVYAYEDPTGTELDIIVQTKLFPQKFAKVTCKHGSSENRAFDSPQCFRKLGLNHFGLNFRCEESKATRSLLVYDPHVDILKMKNYTIPVCCSCKITND